MTRPRVHLSGLAIGAETPRPWCGTPRAADGTVNVTAVLDDVTCARCEREVKRRRNAQRHLLAAEAAAAQGALDITVPVAPNHPSRGATVVSLDEYREAKAGRSGA